MLVGSTLMYVILTFIGILICIPVFWLLFWKLKANPKLVGIGIVPGIIVPMIIYSQTVAVIDVHRDGQIDTYLGWGASTYTSSDGQTVEAKRDDSKDVIIVNGSDRTMALETIGYGSVIYASFSGPAIIKGHTIFKTSSDPDYFPGETPPHSISVSKGSSGASRTWLRYANAEEENHYGSEE
ncbi:MAG TPA: hypothetical protein VI112_03905 [Bacteroidia bacterium]|jgi:hypothetical protein